VLGSEERFDAGRSEISEPSQSRVKSSPQAGNAGSKNRFAVNLSAG